MSRYWRSISRLGHVAHPAEQLHGLVGHPFTGFHGGVLGEAHLGDQIRVAGSSCRSTTWREYTRATSMRRAISASVFCTLCREISGLPKVSRSRHHCDGQVQAALRTRICLHGKADAFGDEGLGDLQEAGVLRADQVGSTGTRTSV